MVYVSRPRIIGTRSGQSESTDLQSVTASIWKVCLRLDSGVVRCQGSWRVDQACRNRSASQYMTFHQLNFTHRILLPINRMDAASNLMES